MKNDLTCGVVLDLLPNYVEHLLGEESQAAVERHLAGCSACAAALSAMREPVTEIKQPSHEVDFLKKIKKRNSRRVLAAAACTALVLLGMFFLKIFVIGTPLQVQNVAVVNAAAENGTLHLSVMSAESANAFHGWNVETTNGIASIYARSVLASPLYADGSASLDIPLEGVQEVWLGGKSGRLIWQDGVMISPLALDLMDARAPYCGDPKALIRIAELLRLPDRLGSYTLSLQTGKHPYGQAGLPDRRYCGSGVHHRPHLLLGRRCGRFRRGRPGPEPLHPCHSVQLLCPVHHHHDDRPGSPQRGLRPHGQV